jgi:hypothetical protein
LSDTVTKSLSGFCEKKKQVWSQLTSSLNGSSVKLKGNLVKIVNLLCTNEEKNNYGSFNGPT